MKRMIAFAAGLALAASLAWAKPTKVCGIVTTQDGKPVAGVCISDGAQIVQTDSHGIYTMKSELSQGFVFMITPSGYEPLSEDGLVPKFWEVAGNSPKNKEIHNFQLRKVDQSTYRMMMITDGHFTNSAKKQDLKFFREKMLPVYKAEAESAKAAGQPVYCSNLGDLSHELYWVENNFTIEDAVKFLSESGFPTMMYSVPGNHDNDAGFLDPANMDRRAEHLYRKVLGPTYYSVNIGGDHWIYMDNVVYKNDTLNPVNPKHPAVLGQRNYNHRFTREELDWLKEDLKYVDGNTSVYFVTHCPLFWPQNDLDIPEEQMNELDEVFSKFSHIEVYVGHEHRMYNNAYHSKWPKWHERVYGAVSGDMWETCPKYQIVGIDGPLAGVETGTYSGGKASYTYKTLNMEEQMMRVYDLNAVGQYYASDEGVATQMKYYPGRTNYSDPKFANGILVNYWWWAEGDKVEVFENGKALEVSKVSYEDPLFNISRRVPAAVKNQKYQDSHKETKNLHMFMATAQTAASPVLVRVTATDGRVFEQLLIRPKTFDKHTK